MTTERNPEVLAEQLRVRRWLETHALPAAGDVTPASIALAVALIAEQGGDPKWLAEPDGAVELIAALAVLERRHVIALTGGNQDRPRTAGPIQ